MTTYDYNTGKPLAAGQVQSTYNTLTGQKIGTNTYSADAIARGIAPQGALPVAGSVNTTITPQSLAPAVPFPLVSPNPVATYPISSLQVPQLQPTAQETQGSGLSTQLGGLYEQMVGKSADQAKANEQFGVNAAQSTIQDLSAQLMGLKNEAAAMNLQQASRQAPTFQISGQQAENNRQVAIKALGISTLLEASQGNLANAQAMANQAVSQKYDPILAQITATKANLDLLMNDPLTSLADKNRALQQQANQDQLTQQTNQAKQDTTEIWSIATTAAQNGNNFQPAGQYTNLAVTLQAISQAPTKEQALQIASSVGLIAPAPGTSVSGASTVHVLGSASTGYFSYDTATGVKTPISGGGSPGGAAGVTAKGNLSSKTFVNHVLSGMGVSYDAAVTAVPKGKIGVIANSTGQVGTIDTMAEYDSSKYTLL